MFPFPLPSGGSEPIDLGEGMTLVGFECATAELVTKVEATLKAAGWVAESTGGDAMGGMWIIEVSKGAERWALTAQGVDNSSQLSIAPG
jgi:hypothetical protein